MSHDQSASIYHVRWEGVGSKGLLCHNGQLADPLNRFAKELKKLSAVRKKTEETYKQMEEVEWFGGLYVDAQSRPVITSECIEGTLVSGAKKLKLGETVKGAVICLDNPLITGHGGPEGATAKELWEISQKKNYVFRHRGPVKIGKAKVIRTRPMFSTWVIEFRIEVDVDVLDDSQIESILVHAQRCGLCDYRPKHGQFVSTILKKEK